MASFTQVSPNNPVPYTSQMPQHISPFPLNHNCSIQSAVLLMKLPTIQSPAVNCFPIPLSHKHLPQHSILRQPQYMFLTQYKATSFTPKYKEANYISVYINFYIFLIIQLNIYIYIYWKIGDEVNDKNCTAICMQ